MFETYLNRRKCVKVMDRQQRTEGTLKKREMNNDWWRVKEGECDREGLKKMDFHLFLAPIW